MLNAPHLIKEQESNTGKENQQICVKDVNKELRFASKKDLNEAAK